MNKHASTAQIQRLIEEIIVTFRQLRIVAAEVHGEGTAMPGQRGVLVDLARIGPLTVSALARARGVSRQHIQSLVDQFQARGLVEIGENPAHQRSKLVGLTARGRALVKTMADHERRTLRSLHLSLSSAQVDSATAVLGVLCGELESLSSETERRPLRGVGK